MKKTVKCSVCKKEMSPQGLHGHMRTHDGRKESIKSKKHVKRIQPIKESILVAIDKTVLERIVLEKLTQK